MEFIVVQGNKTLDLNNKKPLRSVTKAEHRQSLLSEDVINITVESKTPLALQVGNYVEYENRRYTLNSAPKVKKEQGYYTYDLVFEGVQYLLRDKVYFNLDAQGFQNTADFPLTGEINIFLTTLITNINSISDFTWVLGEYPKNTETKTLTFNNENCLAVLQKICQEYDTEFEIKQDLERKSYTLNIKKIGETLNQTFEYGKGNGLYSLSRENVNDSVVTRLYVFGSTNNIKSGYRDYSQRLRLPISHGKDYIQDDNKVALFGLKEGVKNFDDIKPTFKGIVSGVTNLENSSQEIEVSNMDFDLNETDSNGTKYLLNDTPAKLHINKGNLAGYEFELLKNGGYNHATKTFRVKQFTDERGQKFPEAGSVFSFAVGDEVTLLDIALPEQYITNAENKLLEEGQKEYEKQSVNNLKYNLELDPLYLQQIGASTSIFFKIGDYIRVVDEPLKIDKTTRIVDITRDLLDKYDCKIGIADTYEISFEASLLTYIKDTKTVIKTQEQISRQNYLNGYRNQKELQESIFDVDGNLDLTKIRHHSISANMLSTGALGYRMALENVNINPNIEGNPARTFVSGGKIVEFSLEDDIREWNILPYSRNDLLNQVYYVYAKCSRGNSMGVWHITTEKIKFDSRSDYYYFLCYLLYTPKDGKREAEAMYGNVFMHGGQITAGRIKSLNGQTYFDLDSGEIAGTIKFKSGNGYAEVGSAIQQAETNATQVSNAYTLTQSTLAREEAKAHAQTLVDAVQVGGRNLVFNSNFATNSFSGWSSVYGVHEITNGIYKKTITAESGASRLEWIRRDNNSSISENGDYVLTLRYKTTHQLVARSFNGATLQNTVIPPSENFKEVSIPFTVTDFNSLIIRLYVTQPNNGAIIEIDWWKVEKGNKATNGFTPAPEDIQSDIARAEQQATQASNAYAQAQANLAKTQAEAYADGKVSKEEQRAIADAQQKLQLAKEYAQAQDNLKETLIKAYADGKADKAEQSAIAVAEAKANLARLQAEAHADSIVTAEEQARINEAKAKLEEAKAHAQALVNTHRNEVASKFNNLGTMAWQNSVEKAMLGSTIVQGGYIKTELLNASAIVSNGGGATTSQLNSAISSIVVGGRNYIKNASKGYGMFNNNGRTLDLTQGEENGVRWVSGISVNNGNFYISTYFHLLNNISVFTEDLTGQETIQSMEVKPTHDMYIGLWENNRKFCPANVWTKIENSPYNNARFMGIYAIWNDDGSVPSTAKIYHRNWKLEKGNKATDWTPAPEDLDTLFANLQQGIANMQTSLSDVKTKTDNFASIQGGLMMANLMSVGSNQANQNAFISGITDEGAMSVRFGAGANYANKHNAPFRVLDNGKMIAQDADITGRITATGGNIGEWEINGSSFRSSSIGSKDSWAQYSNYALFSPDMFLIRKNGSERGETKEVMMGITSSLATGSEGAAAAIKNNIKKTQYDFDRDNVALRLEAKNGVTNTALDILNGDIRVGGEVGYTGELFLGGVWLTIRKGIITNYS
ncbi:phage tail spike protein [Riemerella anatipestifer]|uniref:phage tail spike protein n=1 Tax=Riemerella anatipestifer TaxID=34085 RepID=UPI0021AACA43|nr:phage tail spike protein [Riemerella anatipestifer]